jgi:polyphosphate kinase 2 (PPK2 family)
LKVLRWAKQNDERIVILFEGLDAAGKRAIIKRFMKHLNPSGAGVVA